jgi:hypothetical protein
LVKVKGFPALFLAIALAFLCLAGGLWWRGSGLTRALVALASAFGSLFVAAIHFDAKPQS